MKKKLLLISLMCCCILLTGCSKKLTCTKTSDENGSSTTEKISVLFKGDKPYSATFKTSMKFSDEQKQYLDMTYEILESAFKSMEEDGVKVNSKKTNDSIKLTMNIEYSKVKKDSDLAIKVDKDNTYKSSKEALEKDGYTCK